MTNIIANNKYNSVRYFLIAFGILNILANTLLLCGLGFLIGLQVSKWQFPLACILALVANYYAVRFFMPERANKHFLKNACTIVGSIIIFIVIAGSFYDVSFDGQWYHQETISYLKQGYNPVRQTIAVPPREVNDVDKMCYSNRADSLLRVNHIYPPKNLKYLAINNFGKGSEVIQAAIYQLTNHIETGKAVNFMLLMGAFFLCLSVLYTIPSINNTKKCLLAILLAFNPLVIVQLLTFYVDGNLGCLFLCLLALTCLIFTDANKYYLFLLISVGSVAINIKYTGLVYTGILGVGFITVLWIYKKTDTLKKVFFAGLTAFTIGVVCSGFNPYINNILKKGNIFYGLEDIRVAEIELTPPLLTGFNRIEKLVISILLYEGNGAAKNPGLWHALKMPFHFNKPYILEAGNPARRLSGFGPFFGVSVFIALIVFLIAIVNSRRTRAFACAVAAIVTILITILIIDDAWWARFVPQLWLLPVIILCLSVFIANRTAGVLRNILYVSLSLNLVWASLSIFFNLVTTARIDYQLQQLKKFNKPIIVQYCNCKGFRTNRIRFAEAGIPVIEKSVSGLNVFSILGSDTKIQTPGLLPILPKPLVLVLDEKLFGHTLVKRH